MVMCPMFTADCLTGHKPTSVIKKVSVLPRLTLVPLSNLLSKWLSGLIFILMCAVLWMPTASHANSVDGSFEGVTFKTPALADPERLITLSVKPTKVMLGEPVTVTIEGAHRDNLFAELDWTRFEAHFVLYDIDRNSERIKVTLYPLQAGFLTIKKQTVGRMFLPDIVVKVATNPEVLVKWSKPIEEAVCNATTTLENSLDNPSDKHPDFSQTSGLPTLYAHQQFAWKAEVQVKDTAHNITYEARTPAVNPSINTYLEPQAIESQASFFGEFTEYVGAESAAKGSTEKRSDKSTSRGTNQHSNQATAKTETLVASYEVKEWPEFVTQEVLLHSPVVVVKNRTNRRWYFFDRPSRVALTPLPRFLPMTTPVGQIEWQSELVDKTATVGELSYWRWQLTGSGMTEAYLNSVAHQLVAQIPHNPRIEWLADSRDSQMTFTKEGVQSVLTLRLPYRIHQPGLVTLPVLELRYFNPGTAKLEVLLSPTVKRLALPVWMIWLGQWLLLLVVGLMTFIGLLALKQAWLNWGLQRAIQNATSLEPLWQALVDWRQNQTDQAWLVLKSSQKAQQQTTSNDVYGVGVDEQSLGQWAEWYRQRFGDCAHFTALLNELNRLRYARPAANIDETNADKSDQAWQKAAKLAQAWSQTLKWWKVPLVTRWTSLSFIKESLKRVTTGLTKKSMKS